jgi:hypothetical protein
MRCQQVIQEKSSAPPAMDENSALSMALSLEIQKMQNWFASEPDAQNWLNLLQGFTQDQAAFFNRWSSFFPQP